MKPKIVIIGAGGHGKVVCDAIIAQEKYDIIGFVDSFVQIGTVVTRNYSVIDKLENIKNLNSAAEYFIVAIGNNTIRKKIALDAKLNLKPATVIHPSAIIGSAVSISEGSVILANAIINSSCLIGENSIINAGSIIDHDCKIGAHVHISIGSKIGSNSEIADLHTTDIGGIVQSFSKINTKPS